MAQDRKRSRVVRKTGGTPAGKRAPDGAEVQIRTLRAEIDSLDQRLVELLNRRAACAVQIGHLKKVLGLDVYQPQRELEVLKHVRESSRGPLTDEAMARLFERIIDEARRLERIAQTEEKTSGVRARK